MTEVIFEVREDEVDGGYTASALGHGIHTEGDSLEELRANVKEAVDCYFDETMEAPKIKCAMPTTPETSARGARGAGVGAG
jgi:predicted RNase H-like HicB family nuclease